MHLHTEKNNQEEFERVHERNFERIQVNKTNFGSVFLVKYLYMHQIFNV